MSTKKKNLDLHLGEVVRQFITIKDEDYKKSQEVFKAVFEQVKTKMGEKCNFFGKYSSQVMYAGSVYDGIKVTKLDEFDMDIVIRLPISYEDIIIENDQAGFLKLKIEAAFDNLDKQKDWEKCHVVTRDWRDSEKYFLQNKFRYWMHGIVQKALNDMNQFVTVNGVTYVVKLGKQSGPAYTLYIENSKGDEPFKLDVDLVPVIRFMHPRWPEGYRTVEESQVKEWLVVPKPNKAIEGGSAQNRCWRLSFQEFEREMMKGCQQLKTTIRLVKKLRDSLQMKDIASYYIKTLFLWKIDKTKDKKYWQKGLSTLFREMVQELHDALKEKNIKYFWHEENNLIEKMKPTVQKLYVDKLKEVLDAIDKNDVDKVTFSLLSFEELQEFQKSDFYLNQLKIQQRHLENSANLLARQLTRQESSVSSTSNTNSEASQSQPIEAGNDVTDSQDQDQTLMELVRMLNNKVSAMAEDQNRLKKIESDAKGMNSRMNSVVDILKDINNKIDSQNERLEKLEVVLVQERDQLKDKIDVLLDKLDIQNDRLKKLEMMNKGSAPADMMNLEIDHHQIRLTP